MGDNWGGAGSSIIDSRGMGAEEGGGVMNAIPRKWYKHWGWGQGVRR